jgi:hypothetical protein
MRYVLELSFKNEPECSKCTLSTDDDYRCAGRDSRPACPENGRHEDCPLQKLHCGGIKKG